MRFCSEALSDIGFGSVPLFESDLKNGERKYNLQILYFGAQHSRGCCAPFHIGNVLDGRAQCCLRN